MAGAESLGSFVLAAVVGFGACYYLVTSQPSLITGANQSYNRGKVLWRCSCSQRPVRLYSSVRAK